MSRAFLPARPTGACCILHARVAATDEQLMRAFAQLGFYHVFQQCVLLGQRRLASGAYSDQSKHLNAVRKQRPLPVVADTP